MSCRYSNEAYEEEAEDFDLLELFFENYQENGIFAIDDNEVKMLLKDVALISGMNVVKIDFKPTKARHPTFRNRFLPGFEKISYQQISQSVFSNRFIKKARSGDTRKHVCP